MENTGFEGRRARGLVAIGLIGLGVVFWLGIGALWPLFVLVPGLAFLTIAIGGGHRTAAFAIPGMIISGTGLLLLVQNLTGYWGSWSYAWTLYGVFMGMGFGLMGRLMGDSAFESLGRVFVIVGGIAFVALGFLMEVIVGIGGLGAGLGPLLLIGLGLFLLARPFTLCRTLGSKHKRDAQLFAGPVVYGSRQRDASRLSASEPDEHRGERR